MYQSDFICTYKMMDEEEEQKILYQVQLLQAFDVIKWNDDIIRERIASVYETMKISQEFRALILYAKVKLSTMEIKDMLCLDDVEIDDFIIFQLLFQYDYFDRMHTCISEYLNKGGLSEITANNLVNIL